MSHNIDLSDRGLDNHESLETLATHLVHEDCPHVGVFDDGGHCYDCTLAHLQKERATMEKKAEALAIQVATAYAYDHVHLGPDPEELAKRLARMVHTALHGNFAGLTAEQKQVWAKATERNQRLVGGKL